MQRMRTCVHRVPVWQLVIVGVNDVVRLRGVVILPPGVSEKDVDQWKAWWETCVGRVLVVVVLWYRRK